MAFVRVNGGVAHYSDEGPRGGKTIVFSNSLGSDFRIWDDVARPLAKSARVICYDTRGHGLSEYLPGPFAIADLAADLAALLDALGVRGATIVGISLGGMIAQELYRLRPDLAASLVLCDTAHRIGTHQTWSSRIASVEAGGLEAIADGVMPVWLSAAFRERYPEAVVGWRAMMTRMHQQGYLALCEALRAADLTEGAKRIRAPTLCVVGEHDASTPVALVRELSQFIPGARFTILADAAHIPCIERPDALRELIEGHLAEIAR